MLYDAYVLELLRFMTATLCAATFSNSYVLWHKRSVMLHFVAVPLELWITPQIFEKILNGPNGLSGAWGKLIHVENLKSKISWHCPFNFPRLKKGIWNNAQYEVEASGSLYKNNCLVSKASIADLCYFSTDPDPRIRASD